MAASGSLWRSGEQCGRLRGALGGCAGAVLSVRGDPRMAVFPAEEAGCRALLRHVHSCARAMPGGTPTARGPSAEVNTLLQFGSSEL